MEGRTAMKYVSVVTVGGVNYTIPTARESGETRKSWTDRHMKAVSAFLETNFPEGGWERITWTEVAE